MRALEHCQLFRSDRQGRVRKRRIVVALSIAVGIGAAAFANATIAGFDRSRNAAVAQSFGASCIASANRAIKGGGGDPDAPAIKQRVGTYCGCMLLAMQARYTPAEFAAIAARNEESLARDDKLNAVVKTCARAAG